jgi:glycosyltransferase involved in cell wall biosynthesis
MTPINQEQVMGEKVRVLRISHSSLTPALRERERALASRYANVDLRLITARQWREAEVDVPATEDDLFPVTAARTGLSTHVQLFAWNPAPIVSALRQHRPHIVDLNHEPFSLACAEVLTLCNWFAPQAAIVLQTAQNIFRRYPPPFGWFQKRAFRRVNAAYACSETTIEILRAKGFDKPMTVIPFGVDLESFKSTAAPNSNQPPVIGFIGRMLPGKGLNILAKALQHLRSIDWKLLVVGDGPDRASFEKELRDSGLQGRAEFVGAVSYDEMPEFYRRLDVLVMPTQTTSRIREQFGRVLVEAMASGVPVIGSTSGAIPEVIGNAGLVTPEGDPAALAEALRELLSDPNTRARLARAGLERVERHYSWERVADKTHEFYRRILRRQAARGLDQTFGYASQR